MECDEQASKSAETIGATKTITYVKPTQEQFNDKLTVNIKGKKLAFVVSEKVPYLHNRLKVIEGHPVLPLVKILRPIVMSVPKPEEEEGRDDVKTGEDESGSSACGPYLPKRAKKS